MVSTPRITSTEEVMVVEVEGENYMTPIIVFLKDATYEEAEESTMRCKCIRYVLVGEELYQRSFSRPFEVY